MTVTTTCGHSGRNYLFEVDKTGSSDWNVLLHGFKDGSIYQSFPYGVVRWGERNTSNVVVKRGLEPVAAALVRLVQFPVVAGGIAYIPWGPIWMRRGKPIEVEVFREVIRVLRDEYVLRRKMFLRIVPNIFDSDGLAEVVRSILQEEGFLLNHSARPYRTLVLDLTMPLPDIRKSLSQKWRNGLNRAEKKGLELLEGTEDNLYSIFQQLYEEMMVRKKFFTGVDVREFREIQNALEDPYKMRIFIALSGGEPVSASIVTGIGDLGIYLLGSTNSLGMETYGSYLLQWRMIQWLKSNGCISYDLGGIDPSGNPGVYHFKSGISQNDVHLVGQFDLVKDHLSRIAIKIGEHLKMVRLKMRGADKNR